MSERQKITKNLHVDYMSLPQVNDQISMLKDKYPELDLLETEFDKEYDYGDTTYLVLKYKIWETDKEMAHRLAAEKLNNDRHEKRAREQYEQLKKKFG